MSLYRMIQEVKKLKGLAQAVRPFEYRCISLHLADKEIDNYQENEKILVIIGGWDVGNK